YRWEFGDGATETTGDPVHIYDSGGSFTVGLTVTDSDGNEATALKQVVTKATLVVELAEADPDLKVGEQADIRVDLQNYERSDVTNLALSFGVDSSILDLIEGPVPSLPSSLPENAK